MPSPSVTAVVLNWNGRDDTLDCLASLRASTYPRLSAVLVDNASSDGCVEAVAAGFPDVDICVNETNLGFAEGVNVGIERALRSGADSIFVLNNDALVEPDSVAVLVDAVETSSEIGAVSPLLHFADDPDLAWFAGATFDPARGYPGRVLGYREPVDRAGIAPFETERLTGAAMLISRRCLDEVGLFDPDLFFLCEDVDWSLRARARGYRLLVVPAAKVGHGVAHSQGGEHSPRSTYYGLRNQVEVCRRHAPLGRWRSARRSLVAALVYLARLRRAPRPLAGLVAWTHAVRDMTRRRLGPWNRAGG
jgi:GT2 family glycosyltransferase